MFGYVTINPETLTDEQKARFREIYCGVCASLGRTGRLTLSYDAAFLALLLNALYEPQEDRGISRCAAHPLKRHSFAVSDMTRYAADMNILLFYFRALDGWEDDRSRVQLLLSKAFKRRVDGVCKRYEKQVNAIKSELANLSQIERNRSDDIDAAAGCFGRLLGHVFAVYDDIWAGTLFRTGEALGRFIYLMDAWDDLEKDKKRGSYNVLSSLAGADDYESTVYNILTLEIARCAAEFEKLPIVADADIIRNILYSGVWTKYQMKRAAFEKKGKTK